MDHRISLVDSTDAQALHIASGEMLARAPWSHSSWGAWNLGGRHASSAAAVAVAVSGDRQQWLRVVQHDESWVSSAAWWWSWWMMLACWRSNGSSADAGSEECLTTGIFLRLHYGNHASYDDVHGHDESEMMINDGNMTKWWLIAGETTLNHA